MPPPTAATTDLIQWLVQQGVLGVVLVLVLIDYRRMYLRLVKKLEYENGTLTAMVRENTQSNTELKASVEGLTAVIEELNPRKKWVDVVRGGGT